MSLYPAQALERAMKIQEEILRAAVGRSCGCKRPRFVYYAQLVAEEGTRTVMAGLKAVVEQRGVFCALYVDRGSHFVTTPVAGGPVDRE
ncbi:MAG: hypothetical protein DMG05_11805 [Acidobacteria bacterium]|nr:MAG: hypothetical protein DMG05_11805 [Acidobacteriota bacterium]